MNKLPKATRKLKHGTPCFCGTCGAAGKWDVMEGGIAEFDDAIWYNPELPHEDDSGKGCIECHECWLK